MKQKKMKLCALLLSVIGSTALQAQTATPASGGNASGSGGTVSYSVGQVDNISANGTNGSVSQGVQQTYVISIATGINQNGIDLSYTAYPNPTTDYLRLKLKDFQLTNYSYKLYDINGKLVETEAITAEETTISVKAYNTGTYFLRIIDTKSDTSKEVKSFKIIKK